MKMHGSCTPHAQWGPSTSCDQPRNAGHLIYIKRPALGFAKCKLTIGSGSARTVMTSVVRFNKLAELGSVFDDQATKAMGEAFEAACKVP